MRYVSSPILSCVLAAAAATAAIAQAPQSPKLLNAAPASSVGLATPVAPQMAWPVVYGHTSIQAVHMTPGPGPAATLPAPVSQAAVAATPPALPPPPAEPTLAVSINLSLQRMTVSENGNAIYTWPVSTARAGYRTPTGTFKPTWMAKMWYSRQYDMAPMPHAVFFSGGVAIHATYATAMLGNPASHGCVRLAPKNAAKFFSLVNKHGKSLTRISVHGTPKANNPAMASKRRQGQPRYAYAQPGYGTLQGGYSPFSTAQPYGQPPRPYQGKRLKASQKVQVVRTSGNGFGYGFGGL